MDIHVKSVDMDMDMDVKIHIHGNPGTYPYALNQLQLKSMAFNRFL